MNQSLAKLMMSRVVTRETGMAASSNKDELLQILERGRVPA
jgi:hypothetical protein